MLFLFLISAVACRKDSTPAANYYIKATINGTLQTFTKNVKAIDFWGEFSNALTLSAYDSSGSPAISLTLSHNYAPVTTGTYLQGFHDTANVYSILGTYQSYLAGLNSGANPPFTITITQINKQTVTGTFEGQYFDTTLAKPLIIITNGAFYLPFK